MKNIIKIFLCLFISFYIAVGINNFLPEFHVEKSTSIVKTQPQLFNKQNTKDFFIVSSNSLNENSCIFQGKRKNQIAHDSYVKNTLFFLKNKKTYFTSDNALISFHNISYCLKNEIHTRAP